MATSEELLGKINRQLEIIAGILLFSGSGNASSTIAERIHMLHGLGLSPSEIGRYVNKQANYVSATLQKVRTKGDRKN
jgi:hypothetical protein